MSRQLRDEAWQRIAAGLDVSASAKVLLLAIAEHVDVHGELWAKEETIAGWIARSGRTVRRRLTELVETGCLIQTSRSAPDHTARYKVLLVDPRRTILATVLAQRRTILATVLAQRRTILATVLAQRRTLPAQRRTLLAQRWPAGGHQNQKNLKNQARAPSKMASTNGPKNGATPKAAESGF